MNEGGAGRAAGAGRREPRGHVARRGAGSVERLHAFRSDGIDGRWPLGRLIEGRDGLIYGTTLVGGQHQYGTSFRMHRNGGREPLRELLLGRDGAFYGTTSSGGAYGHGGTIFRFTPSDGVLTGLHSFPEGPEGDEAANALVEVGDGELVGATEFGGEGGQGTIYRMRVPPLR